MNMFQYVSVNFIDSSAVFRVLFILFICHMCFQCILYGVIYLRVWVC